MNKRGQIDNPIIAFVIIVIALLLIAPIALKMFSSIHTNVGNAFGNVSGQGGVIAKANFEKVTGTLINFWDKIIIAAFIFSIIMLFVSAFLIDAHPFFIILYIFLAFMMVLFTPHLLTAVDKIYDSPQFATELTHLAFLDSLRNNFMYFLVGIIVITGIIIYGKLAFTNRSNNRR